MNDNYIEFYLNKFSCQTKQEDLDLGFIPPLMRRRLSTLDKYTVSVLNKIFTDEVENIVCSSQAGEFERLIKLIEQYTEEKEVSPNTFAGSVHNYGVSFFLMNKQTPIPYTALSGGDNSLSSGFLAAVVSDFANVLYCYSDIINDEPYALGVNIGVGVNAGINGVNGDKFRMLIVNNSDISDNITDYVDLFIGRTDKIVTPYFELERVCND